MSNKKKLVFVLPEYDVNTASHYKYLVDLLEDAAKQLEVFLFIESGNGNPKFENIQDWHIQKWQTPGINLLERFFWFLRLRIRGYKRFYVHYSYFSAIIAGIVTRLARAKSFVWYCEQKNLYSGGKWPFRFAIKLIHNVVTCTNLMANYYHEFYKVPKHKIRVMHNWVDVDEMSNKQAICDKGKRKSVLFVHWLSPRKGAGFLPEIIDKTLAKTDCDFVIVGDGPLYNTLKNIKNDRVKLIGAVPNREVVSHYKCADVFIMPSREEEFGRVMIEAMAAGTPIVAFETLGSKAVLNHEQKQFMVPQSDIDTFTDKITELLENDDLRHHMSRVGIQRVKNFDKKLSLEKFIEIVS